MPLDNIVPNLVMYFQVSCRSDESQLEQKNMIGMVAAFLGAIMIFVFKVTISDLDINFQIDRKFV